MNQKLWHVAKILETVKQGLVEGTGRHSLDTHQYAHVPVSWPPPNQLCSDGAWHEKQLLFCWYSSCINNKYNLKLSPQRWLVVEGIKCCCHKWCWENFRDFDQGWCLLAFLTAWNQRKENLLTRNCVGVTSIGAMIMVSSRTLSVRGWLGTGQMAMSEQAMR